MEEFRKNYNLKKLNSSSNMLQKPKKPFAQILKKASKVPVQ